MYSSLFVIYQVEIGKVVEKDHSLK